MIGQKINLSIVRICLSLTFLVSGISKIFNWKQMEEQFTMKLTYWHDCLGQFSYVEKFFSFILPYAIVLLALFIVLEIVGAILISLGISEKIGVLCLLLYLIPQTLMFHHFWNLEGISRDQELIMFLKNICIMGGLVSLFMYRSQAKYMNVSS